MMFYYYYNKKYIGIYNTPLVDIIMDRHNVIWSTKLDDMYSEIWSTPLDDGFPQSVDGQQDGGDDV